MKRHQSGVVSSGSNENAEMRFVQFPSILLNLGGKVIVVPRFRDFCDAFILFIRVQRFQPQILPRFTLSRQNQFKCMFSSKKGSVSCTFPPEVERAMGNHQ